VRAGRLAEMGIAKPRAGAGWGMDTGGDAVGRLRSSKLALRVLLFSLSLVAPAANSSVQIKFVRAPRPAPRRRGGGPHLQC
jgi:hypothetical protein